MALGTRETDRPPLWIATSDLPTSPGHLFYARLTTLLDGHHFGRFVEGLCARFYAPVLGRPSLAPGRSFRLCWSATARLGTGCRASSSPQLSAVGNSIAAFELSDAPDRLHGCFTILSTAHGLEVLKASSWSYLTLRSVFAHGKPVDHSLEQSRPAGGMLGSTGSPSRSARCCGDRDRHLEGAEKSCCNQTDTRAGANRIPSGLVLPDRLARASPTHHRLP